ncbi:hypothetical protein QUH73_16950 [Labilibaculum sp. K2S]|uniref:hypothetical protein n=1 Tax=Labilibaculum sp. K2S TaxID=3056386 RepID=UPI0025A3AFFA|nr:hypothetical protein [Labilibaculum sp. K2S]MDM8161512.1 hypothetical protein [Labilibaculum sp. K2S]
MNKQIPRNIVSILLLVFALLLTAGTSNAQQYPVQCNVQLIPPYSVHLADYYQGGNQKLLVNLTLKDLNHADLSVRLRISIEGQGIKLITKDDFIPKNPVLLQAGTPELLYGDRLEEYLVPEHMNFSGITKKQFLKTGRLPEGVYKFTVEIFEARRQEKVSNTATSMAWMLLNEPPVITAPANNKLLKATDPASIFFNWLPRHMNSQNALSDVEYEFTMVEIWPVNQSAEEAIRSKEPLLKTVFRNTSFVYDAQYPMLVPGRQYACRVRAFSNQQKEMFKNEGYSPVVSFVFGEECKPPLLVDVDPALGGSAQLSIVPQSNHSSFTVQIRDVAGDKWYSQQSNQPDFELKQLKPGATYQYKVQAQCETLESEFTPISQFSLSKEQAEVECGQSASIPEIDGSPALNQLTAGDVINAGGFKVTVKQASGSRGTFTGSGVVRIGMLGNIELRTVFDNIKVNESYQLTAGEIRVVGSDIYALGSDIRDQADDFFNNDIWDSVDDAIADAESIVDEISNLQTDMGNNSLNNELEKAKRTIEKGRDQLAVGNQEGAQLVKEGADKVAQILDQVNSGDFQITANGIFFLAHDNQNYGFDSHEEGLTEEEKKAYLPYYQSLQLGDTTKQYYLKAWKSIGSNGNDVVKVEMQLSNGMKADTVHFMNAMGAEIAPQKQGDAFSLNLRGSFHEDVQQITAYYNVKNDSTKNTKKVLLGALNVISYDQIEKNLVLVPVNGNATSIPRAQLETYLNDTYSPANVRWTVSQHAGVQVEYSNDMNQGLDDGESKMLSNYTKEMNKVIKALKRSGDYDQHKTYVFLVDKAQTASKAGFMPKKRPWGFVFTNIHYNNSKALCRTISHELAHGEFRLSHPFQDFPSVPENSTQNLMDYADGQQLRKYQWDDIHNLRDVELYGQDEEGNASMDMNMTAENIKNLLDLIRDDNVNKKTHSNLNIYSFSKGKVKNMSLSKDFILDYFEVEVGSGRQLSDQDPIKRDSLTIKPKELHEEIIETPEGEEGEFIKVYYNRYDRKIPTIKEYEKSDKLALWFKVKKEQVVELMQYLKGDNITGVEFPCEICGRELKLDLDKLNLIFPGNKTITQSYVDYLNVALKKGDFSTCKRQAHFFSQVAVESKSFTDFEEDYWYRLHEIVNGTAVGIYATFGKQSNESYKTLFDQNFWDENHHLEYIGATGCSHLYHKESSCKDIKDKNKRYTGVDSYTKTRNDYIITFPKTFKKDTLGMYVKYRIIDSRKCGEKLFNLVYKDANGNVNDGDGWRYRGRGAIQVTGRSNYRKVSEKCNSKFGKNFDWENNPDLLKTDGESIIYSAVSWFLNAFKPIECLDDKTANQVTKIVNAGQKARKERSDKFNELMNNDKLYKCKKK